MYVHVTHCNLAIQIEERVLVSLDYKISVATAYDFLKVRGVGWFCWSQLRFLPSSLLPFKTVIWTYLRLVELQLIDGVNVIS